MTGNIAIALNGLSSGKQRFSWQAGKEFFETFDNSDIQRASIEVEAEVVKSLEKIDIDLSLKGLLTVPCDRCLADLDVPVDETLALEVRFGEAQAQTDDSGKEILNLDPDAETIDLDQVVYDTACLAVPMHRVHGDGQCDPSVIRHLASDADLPNVGGSPEDSPFAALKGLF